MQKPSRLERWAIWATAGPLFSSALLLPMWFAAAFVLGAPIFFDGPYQALGVLVIVLVVSVVVGEFAYNLAERAGG